MLTDSDEIQMMLADNHHFYKLYRNYPKPTLKQDAFNNMRKIVQGKLRQMRVNGWTIKQITASLEYRRQNTDYWQGMISQSQGQSL